jgi:hypothetical protein
MATAAEPRHTARSCGKVEASPSPTFIHFSAARLCYSVYSARGRATAGQQNNAANRTAELPSAFPVDCEESREQLLIQGKELSFEKAAAVPRSSVNTHPMMGTHEPMTHPWHPMAGWQPAHCRRETARKHSRRLARGNNSAGLLFAAKRLRGGGSRVTTTTNASNDHDCGGVRGHDDGRSLLRHISNLTKITGAASHCCPRQQMRAHLRVGLQLFDL